MSTNGTLIYQDDLIHNKFVQIIFILIYFLIFSIGLIGNILVCGIVICNRNMQTVTNYFILNLSLADILLCLLAVPFTPMYTFLNKWIFGEALCHLVPYAQAVSIYVSTFTLTSIAYERFRLIVHPHKTKLSLAFCLKLILAIWFISLSITSPYIIFMRYDSTRNVCNENWPSESFRKLFSCFTTISQFIMPFIIITYCYIRIANRLTNQSRLMVRRQSHQKKRPNKTINHMLIAMVIIFLLCWLPLNIINILSDFSSENFGNFRNFLLVFFITHSIAMSSTCHNPFIYGWLNENFRKEFLAIFRACCK